MKRRALISVTDKTGVVDFARGLVDLGFEVLSTGGTFRVLRDAGVPAGEVADYTGFPEMMDGRVKTLHPKVHGGILARRGDSGDRAAMTAHGIDCIDLVAVNLYRFRETTQKPNATRAEIVENIDIGGPALIRSAAKNHTHVAVVVDPADYPRVLEALRRATGHETLLRELAGKAYAHTAAYDTAIAAWFAEETAFPQQVTLLGTLAQELRYGENPHQKAALYRSPDAPPFSLAASKQLLGKELSFNNLLDLDAALKVAFEHEAPCCAIIKHANPCGCAVAETLPTAFLRALDGDPQSAFGGILACNLPLDAETAKAIVRSGTFVEAIVAPEVSSEALAELKLAKWGQNVRVLALGGRPRAFERREIRQVLGGFLMQEPDVPGRPDPQVRVVTKRAPTPAEDAALRFAWKVAKHVKSNAIVFAKALAEGVGHEVVGVGAGQMSRVDSVHLAARKAAERARGAVCASDAFFPFADGLEGVAAAGVTAVIQPGGSKRDAEVIEAADKAGVAMVFAGERHFRH